MNLRQYQSDCIEAVLRGWAKFQRQLVVAPTGSGKTILFSHLAHRTLPGRTLILAHREELIDQAIAKLQAATGIFADKEMAEFKASRNADVVVASVQSMIRRLDRWPSNHFSLVVADEAHHAISDSWQRVLGHFEPANVLGVTATADRGDKRNLGVYFESVAFEIGLLDLIHQGYLSPIALESVPLKIDLRNVTVTAGDYAADSLGDALKPYVSAIADTLADKCAFRRTLVFLPLIATSRMFTEAFQARGMRAEHVDGESQDRSEKLARFASGKTEILCNAMLLTEGYDNPHIDCVVVLRPTKSRALYSQMVGRGTRIAPAKRHLLLLDFLWLHERHKLVRPAHLVSQSDELADEITEAAQAKAGGESQMPLDLEDLATETQAKREEKLRQELEAKAKRRARVMNATEFALSLHNLDVAEYEPTMPWESEPVSDRQAEVLRKFGMDLDTVRDSGHASKLLDMLIGRSRRGLASPKQIQLLRQLKHPRPEACTFEQASAYLNARLKRGKK